MSVRKITGVTNGRTPYVCGARDPRKIPLDRCVSLGDLMATLQRCKELDEKDKMKNKKTNDTKQKNVSKKKKKTEDPKAIRRNNSPRKRIGTPGGFFGY